MSIQQHGLKAAVVAVVALVAASQASADALIGMTRAGNFTFAAPTTVPIAVGVTSSPAFFNNAGQRFIVSYTAECAVAAAAGNTTTWMDLNVVAINTVTGAVFTLAPTVGTLDAFCTSNGTAGNDGWSMNAVNAIGGAGMPAGTYRVQVRARLSGAGTGHLGDSSLIVWR